MKLLKFDEKLYSKDWDDFVRANSSGSFFHLTAWKRIIERSYGMKSLYYLGVEGNDIVAIIPFFRARGFLQNKIMVSLPYASYAGILIRDDIEQYNSRSILLRLGWDNKSIMIREWGKNNISNEIMTMMLDLPNDSDSMWKNFKPKVRNQIRKAEKRNICFTTGQRYLDDFYQIYSINMKRLGTPAHKYSFFKNILMEFGKNSDIWVVKKENIVIGGMLVIFYNKTVCDYAASTLAKYNRDCANMMLYWGALKKSVELRFSKFDFGRSTRGTGTYQFKKQWGAQGKILDYYVIKNGCKALVKVPQPGIVSNIWSKSPKCFTDFIGPKIRKYIF